MTAAISHRPEFMQNGVFTWKKALICVPIVGLVASSIFEMQVELKIQLANNPRQLVNLITLKNQYKKYIIVSCVLTIITSVALAAMRIFPVYHTVACSLLLAALIGMEIYWIHKGNLKIDEIKNRTHIPQQAMHIH